MNNDTQITYCYGMLSNVDKQMPWGTSRDHFKFSNKLDRDQMVNTWWAKINNYEFIKEIQYISLLSDKEYVEISKYQIGKHFEIMLLLENYSKWLNENPCPVKLLFVGKGKYQHRTELLGLTKSQLTVDSGQKIPLDLLRQHRFENATEFSSLCHEWNIEEEHSGLYAVVI